MTGAAPQTLSNLLHAQDPASRERAWAAFMREYSRLIHLAARKSARAYDDVMDRYTFVLEALQEEDLKRLRAFDPNGRSKFTTWLVVVSSRLCVDFHRRTYGRFASDDGTGLEASQRRRLVDLVGEEIDLSRLPDARSEAPDLEIRQKELRSELEEALGSLGNEERLLLRLRFEDQHSAKDIAQMLGLSSEFVAYRRLKSTLEKLRKDLEQRGVHEPRP